MAQWIDGATPTTMIVARDVELLAFCRVSGDHASFDDEHISLDRAEDHRGLT